ncbi:MAG: imelysin family protein [Bacteroidota bacterium]
MSNKNLTFLFAILVIILGCKSEETVLEEENTNCDKSDFIEYYINTIVSERLTQYEATIRALDESLGIFTNNLDVASLEAARNSYKEALIAYNASKWYRFEPPLSTFNAINFSPYHSRWPISSEKIETKIETGDFSIEDYQFSLRGIYAIEYFLFGVDDEQLLIESFDASRIEYLKLISSQLKDRAQTVKKEWIEWYANNEIGSSASEIKLILDVLYNALLNDCNEILRQKLQIPMGLFSFEAEIRPEKVESLCAKMSIFFLKAHFDKLAIMYFGGDKNSNAIGWDDLLKCSENGEKINSMIIAKIEIIEDLFDNLPADKSMQDLLSEDFASLEILNEQVNELNILIKLNLSSQLGLIILYGEVEDD